MSNKNQPMPVNEWFATRARELVEHVRRHHAMTDSRVWEQHIGELLQEEADRQHAAAVLADEEQHRRIYLLWRGDPV